MTDAQATRFEPPVTTFTEPFWDATREGRLLLPWCRSCERPFWFPREACPRDLSPDIEWRPTDGRGSVHAVSVMPKPGNPLMAGREPYVVALVDLDEGVRVMSTVVGADPWSVAVGERVVLAWEPLSDGRQLYVFERDGANVTREEAAKVGMVLAVHAAEAPDRPAIASPTGDRTFGELNGGANAVVRALRRRGLRAGSAVALICANRPEFAEVYFAAHRAGFRLTTVNWHLTPAEAAVIVEDCEAEALVADTRFPDLALSSVGVRLAVGGDLEGFERYEEVVGAEDTGDIDDPVLGSTMLYTSGTTGRPKGVHRTTPPPNAVAGLRLYGYRPGEDRHLCTGPLYHAAPLAFSLNAPLSAGVGVVLMDGWDAEEALRLVEEHRVTHTHMVPTMFHRLLSLPEDVRRRHDLSTLRFVLHGAAPCPVSVKRRLIEWLGPVVWEYYAATEGVGSFVDSATWLAHPGTVGKPILEDQVLIGDERAEPLPAGEVGLVWLKAPATGRFSYFKDEAKTASTYIGDRFTLGDMGYLDDEGYLYLTDRTANLIITGGVNVYPAEVDAALLEHPAVADAATIGVPSVEWGEEVKAVVELQAGVPGSPALADELVAHCRERLAGFKCPRTVDFVDALPRQDNGKIYKGLLRERYRERATT